MNREKQGGEVGDEVGLGPSGGSAGKGGELDWSLGGRPTGEGDAPRGGRLNGRWGNRLGRGREEASRAVDREGENEGRGGVLVGG